MGAALIAMTAAGAAHSACGPSAMIAHRLSERFDEELAEQHLVQRGDVIATYELWTAEKGTWTILARIEGVSCIFAAGERYNGRTLADWLVGVAA